MKASGRMAPVPAHGQIGHVVCVQDHPAGAGDTDGLFMPVARSSCRTDVLLMMTVGEENFAILERSSLFVILEAVYGRRICHALPRLLKHLPSKLRELFHGQLVSVGRRMILP